MDGVSQARTRELIDRAVYAQLGVISDGDPYVTPLSFVRIGDALFFRCFPGERLDAIRSHPSGSMSIVEYDKDSGSWESVIIRGDITLVEDGKVVGQVIEAFFDRYANHESVLDGGPVQPRDGQAAVFEMDTTGATVRSSTTRQSEALRPGRL